jgi:hypothetical protein
MIDRELWAWRPQSGPQKALVDCSVKEIFFGGTRGGGGVDFGLQVTVLCIAKLIAGSA